MICKLWILILLSSIHFLNVQAQLPEAFNCAIGVDSNQLAKVNVYIFSHPGCGYCIRAFKELGEWAQGKPINLIAMDVSGKIEKIKGKDDLIKIYKKYSIQLIDATPCGEKYSRFIPKIYFFETSAGEQIMKMKGWGKGDMDKVQKALQKFM